MPFQSLIAVTFALFWVLIRSVFPRYLLVFIGGLVIAILGCLAIFIEGLVMAAG
jgi:hypothetical protein